MLAIVLSTLLVTLPPHPVHPVRSGEMTVKVDSANRTVTLSAGPFRIEGSHAMPGMAGHHGMHEGMEMPLRYFKWPVAGWTRGFELSLSDGQGRPIARNGRSPVQSFPSWDRRGSSSRMNGEGTMASTVE